MALNSPHRQGRTPEFCPVCGEDVPARALACPGCGADHRSGWRESADDDGFDYEAFVKEEFGSSNKATGIKPVWWMTAVLLILAFAWYAFHALFP